MRVLATIIFAAVLPLSLAAQETATVEPAISSSNRGLPDAPDHSTPASTSNRNSLAPTGSATIFGTVLDTNGSEVQGARVVLTTPASADERVTKSNADGEFTFAGLPPGEFKLAVNGPGWGSFVSPDIVLHAGDFHILSNIVLPLSASATVRVSANPDEIAEEQVHIAEQQRVLGVFPNFYSSYDWHAPPLGSRQKFQLVFRSLSDPVTFLGVGTIAGIEQASNTFPGYGQGMQGYAKRFGAAYADDLLGRTLSQAAFPSLFHQDPRYFYKGNGSASSRAFYAMSAAVIARGDNGRWQPNYSHILGSFAAGALSNLYYPSGSRGAKLTALNGLVDIANYAGTNLLREFVLKRFTTKASNASSGQP